MTKQLNNEECFGWIRKVQRYMWLVIVICSVSLVSALTFIFLMHVKDYDVDLTGFYVLTGIQTAGCMVGCVVGALWYIMSSSKDCKRRRGDDIESNISYFQYIARTTLKTAILLITASGCMLVLNLFCLLGSFVVSLNLVPAIILLALSMPQTYISIVCMRFSLYMFRRVKHSTMLRVN